MSYAVFKDPNDLENGDMVVLDEGRLDIYNKIDGVRSTVPTTPLKKYKAGSAAIGSWTELPGYWTETPKVLVAAKKLPTYYARHRLGQQRFTISCEVQSTGAAMKYRIRPTAVFYAAAGASGNVTVNEHLEYNYDVSGHQNPDDGAPLVRTKVTSPQPGSGLLTVNFSWQTRGQMYGNFIRPDGLDRHNWVTNCQIYIDKFKVSAAGEISVESQQLMSETGLDYWQDLQTTTVANIDLGNGTCSWVLRKETQCIRSYEADDGRSTDTENALRLNWYSYTTSAETLTNPTGEVFYLAIGR